MASADNTGDTGNDPFDLSGFEAGNASGSSSRGPREGGPDRGSDEPPRKGRYLKGSGDFKNPEKRPGAYGSRSEGGGYPPRGDRGGFSPRGRGEEGRRGDEGRFPSRGRGEEGRFPSRSPGQEGRFPPRGRGDFGPWGRGDFGGAGRGEWGAGGRGDFGPGASRGGDFRREGFRPRPDGFQSDGFKPRREGFRSDDRPSFPRGDRPASGPTGRFGRSQFFPGGRDREAGGGFDGPRRFDKGGPRGGDFRSRDFEGRSFDGPARGGDFRGGPRSGGGSFENRRDFPSRDFPGRGNGPRDDRFGAPPAGAPRFGADRGRGNWRDQEGGPGQDRPRGRFEDRADRFNKPRPPFGERSEHFGGGASGPQPFRDFENRDPDFRQKRFSRDEEGENPRETGLRSEPFGGEASRKFKKKEKKKTSLPDQDLLDDGTLVGAGEGPEDNTDAIFDEHHADAAGDETAPAEADAEASAKGKSIPSDEEESEDEDEESELFETEDSDSEDSDSEDAEDSEDSEDFEDTEDSEEDSSDTSGSEELHAGEGDPEEEDPEEEAEADHDGEADATAGRRAARPAYSEAPEAKEPPLRKPPVLLERVGHVPAARENFPAPQSDFVRAYSHLKNEKGRLRECRFLLEGVKPITEVLESSPDIVHELLVSPELDDPSLLGLARMNRIPLRKGSSADLQQLSDTETPQGAIAIVNFSALRPDWNLARYVTLLDGVQDPGNVGAILRTSLALGMDAAILGKGTCEAYNPKVVRSSVGALLRLPFETGVDLGSKLKLLRQKGFTIVATSSHATQTVDQVKLRKKVALMVGNEGAGTGAKYMDMADAVVKIPLKSQVESLNVAVAHGILCHGLLSSRT